MADNTTLNAGTGGDVIASDDIGGVKHQLVKLEYGAADSATQVSAVNPLPVVQTGTHAVNATLSAETTKVIGTVNLSAAQTLATVTTVTAVTAISNALPAGTNAIGKLAANSGVDIGDIDVTSIIPGVGATNLGKAEDAVHADGDTGVMALAVRRDANTALAGTTGDYAPLQVDATGNLKVAIISGAGSGGTALADAAAFTRTSTSITPIGGVVETAAPTVTNGNATVASFTTGGAMRVAVSSGSISGAVDDAALAAGTAEGIPVVGYYSSTRDSIDSGDGGFIALSSRRAQYVIGDTITSTVNSTTANLAGAAAFTGTSEDVSDFARIQINVFSSHASGTDGLSIQQSSDGTNWDHTDVYTIAATTGKLLSLPVQAKFFRLVYTNGATLTTSLRIQTMFKGIAATGSSQRPSDATSNENDMEMTTSFSHGFNGTTWDRLRTVNTGMLQVAPTYAGTVASTGVGASGAQTQRVVTATDSTIGTLTNITNWGNIVDDAAFTPATTRVSMSGFQADETGTDSIDEGDGGAARMTLDRKIIVNPQPHAQGGCSQYTGALSNTAVAVKASAGQVYGWYFYNNNATMTYIQFWNTAQGSVTVGTTPPVYSIGIPANSGANVFGIGIAHGTAITIAATTARANSTAPGTAVDANVFYF